MIESLKAVIVDWAFGSTLRGLPSDCLKRLAREAFLILWTSIWPFQNLLLKSVSSSFYFFIEEKKNIEIILCLKTMNVPIILGTNLCNFPQVLADVVNFMLSSCWLMLSFLLITIVFDLKKLFLVEGLHSISWSNTGWVTKSFSALNKPSCDPIPVLGIFSSCKGLTLKTSLVLGSQIPLPLYSNRHSKLHTQKRILKFKRTYDKKDYCKEFTWLIKK